MPYETPNDPDVDYFHQLVATAPDEIAGNPWGIVNWEELWARDHTAEEWLIEPIIAAKRGHAIVAKAGAGKSLFTLWGCAALATGGNLLRGRNAAVDVLYADYEMSPDDLIERLEAMGYGPDDDLTHLHYAQLPSVEPLDTRDGGLNLVTQAEAFGAQLVVIDTYGRAVQGDENEADTTRAFYRYTASHLKRLGIAFVRVDHLGKDQTKGARGSSAKNDDVDVVWQMEARDLSAVTLKATKRRISWVPEVVELTQLEDPYLRYELSDGQASWPAGTAEVAAELDDLGVPVAASTRDAMKAYREAQRTGGNAVIRAAVKYRKGREITIISPVDKPSQPVDKVGQTESWPTTTTNSGLNGTAQSGPPQETPGSEVGPVFGPPWPTDAPCVWPSVGLGTRPTGTPAQESTDEEDIF